MQLMKVMGKIHKWLGLIIGLQVVFWVFGGLVMSSFPIDQVHGDHLRNEIQSKKLNVSAFYPIVELVTQCDFEVKGIVIEDGFFGPQYRLTDMQNKLHFYHAKTGLVIEPLTETEALTVAKKLYSGNGKLLSQTLITQNSTEYRKRIPAWRVEFDDSESATFYIAVDNGELMSVRNSMWRIFDFVWMLHIMDYQQRTDFNSWLLIIAAALALVISLSGLYLVYKAFTRKH